MITPEQRIELACRLCGKFQMQMFNGARYGQPGNPTFQAVVEILTAPDDALAENMAALEKLIDDVPAIAETLVIPMPRPRFRDRLALALSFLFSK